MTFNSFKTPVLKGNRSNLNRPVTSSAFAATTSTALASADATDKLGQVASVRELMGHFFVNIIVILCVYTVVVEYTANLTYDVGTSIFIAVCLLLGLLLPTLWMVIRRSPLSLPFYGLTCVGWQRAVRDAVIYSLPILALTVIAKSIAIQLVPRSDHLDLFSGKLSQYPLTGIHLLQLGIYISLIPLQEFVARGVLQGLLQEFLTGRHVVLKAILISNLLFSTFHLYVSPYFAVAAYVSWSVDFVFCRS